MGKQTMNNGEVSRRSPAYDKAMFMRDVANDSFPDNEWHGAFYSLKKHLTDSSPVYFIFEDVLDKRREIADMLMKEGYRVESAGPISLTALGHWSKIPLMTREVAKTYGQNHRMIFALESEDSMHLLGVMPEGVTAIDSRGKSNLELVEIAREHEKRIVEELKCKQ